MSAKAFVVTPENRPRALDIVGERLTVLADTGATGGGYEIFLQEGAAGSGPPPHHHDWDESFFVFEGEVEFGFDGTQQTATAGTLVHLPAGTVHWFRFGPAGGRMLSLTGAGSSAAAFFTAVDAEIAGGALDVPKLVAVGARHDLRFD